MRLNFSAADIFMKTAYIVIYSWGVGHGTWDKHYKLLNLFNMFSIEQPI